MQKIIPGSSRAAWSFMAANWQALAKMSALPFVAYAAVSYWQINTLIDLYRQMGNMVVNGQMDPAFFGSYMRGMSLTSLGSFAAFCLLGILFAQIIRFQRGEAAAWLPASGKAIKAGLMTLVYGLGIMLLTMLAYMGGALAFALVGGILGAVLIGLLGQGTGGLLLALLIGVGVIGLVAGLYWFAFRFLVGLPGVALGHSPDFFKDMWPLSRGEGFAVPLRMLFATLLLYIPMFLVLALFAGSAFGEFMTASSSAGDNPNVVFPLLADMMEDMMPAMVLVMLIYMPFMWFVTLLLGEAFQRFRGRQAQAK